MRLATVARGFSSTINHREQKVGSDADDAELTKLEPLMYAQSPRRFRNEEENYPNKGSYWTAYERKFSNPFLLFI